MNETLPNGQYFGYWSGYSLRVPVGDSEVTLTTKEQGVRGMNIPVKFNFKDGNLIEDSIEVL